MDPGESGFYRLENMRSFAKNELSISHLPTLMLMIGYPVFWLEMFFHRNNQGVTSAVAWILFLGLACYVVWAKFKREIDVKFSIASFQALSVGEKFFIGSGVVLAGVMLLAAAYASLLPPHLMQEADVLSYHYTLPRQNLIANSFAHFPWSVFDVFPYPVQFALAPYWFATVLPNKVPQFFFLLGILGMAFRLTGYFSQNHFLKSLVAVLGVLAAHHVGIQSGTAMLDLVIAYLFFAAIDSFLRGQVVLAALEMAFYVWSKSFLPIQTIALILAVGATWGVARHFKFKISLAFHLEELRRDFKDRAKKFLGVFLAVSLLIGGPFWFKSLVVTGTPLYPFFVPTKPPTYWQNQDPSEWNRFLAATQMLMGLQNAYGLERTPVNFVKHFWLVAVPEKGVNNRFDYPLGLIYLLCVGPLVWLFLKSLIARHLSLIPLFIILFWLSWWFGSQQTRFLYVPVLLMTFVVFAEVKVTRILLFAVFCALFLNVLSVVRAHKMDWGQSPTAVLHVHDREMLKANKEYLAAGRQDTMKVDHLNVGYAQFPVFITVENLPYVIKVQRH